jgi:hypothetical protein
MLEKIQLDVDFRIKYISLMIECTKLSLLIEDMALFGDFL